MKPTTAPLRRSESSTRIIGLFCGNRRGRGAILALLLGLALCGNTPLNSAQPTVQPPVPDKNSQPGPARPSGSDRPEFGPEIVESLSASELKEAIEQLKSHYFKPGAFAEVELERALLAGILARIAPGASIVPSNPIAPEATVPFKLEILKDTVAYLRMGSLTKANLAELDAALKSIAGGPVDSAILDLRSTPPSNDFQIAAEVLRRFCLKAEPIFSIGKSLPPVAENFSGPLFKGPLMVLMDRENAGASEVVAAVLRLSAKAVLVGSRTKGEGVEFAQFQIGSGKAIRVAVSDIVISDGTQIYPEGVKPDLAVVVDPETKRKVLAKELEKGVAPLVVETERPRMNEASLVAGTNPEMDAYQNARKAAAEKAATPDQQLRDTVLQRGLDLITTIRIYAKSPN